MAVLTVRRRGRQWLLFAHVVLSIGWLGAGAANVVLALTAARTTDSEIQRACYRLIHVLDSALVIPLAFGALASGLLISLATKWGLWRYWWVIVKFALTVLVIVFSTFDRQTVAQDALVPDSPGHHTAGSLIRPSC